MRKRYLAHLATLNLGLVLRKSLGAGTPRALATARKGRLWVVFVVWAFLAAVVRDLGRRLAWFSQRAWCVMGVDSGWTAVPIFEPR